MKFLFLTSIFFLIGVFTPTEIYACGNTSSKEAHCSLESRKEKKSCCGNSSCSVSKETCCKDSKGCKGKCGDPNCKCPTNSLSFLLPTLQKVTFELYIEEKSSNIFTYKPFKSSGFISIWLLPKIS